MIFASKLFPNPFTNNNCRYQSQILCVTVYTKINIYIFCLTIDHLFKLIFVTCSFKHLKNIKSYFHSIQFFTTATMHLFFFSLSQIYKIGLHCAGNMALYNKLPTIFSRSGFPYHNLIIPRPHQKVIPYLPLGDTLGSSFDWSPGNIHQHLEYAWWYKWDIIGWNTIYFNYLIWYSYRV